MAAGDVSGREGTPVGDQRPSARRQLLQEQVELLGDGGMTVVVAVGHMPQQGDGALLIHSHTQVRMDHLGVGDRVAEGNVGRRIVGRRSLGVGSGVGAGLGRGIGTVKNNVGRIVVKAVEADMKSLGDVEGQAGADGMALVVKGIEGTAEAVGTL